MGPGAEHKQSCVSGRNRCFATTTNSFGLSMTTSLFQVTHAATCADVAETPQTYAEKFRFQWNPVWTGAYLDTSLPGRKWMAGQDPGMYTLCWCQNDTEGACESLSDFNVSAGQMTWHGPFRKEVPIVATIGEVLEVELSGVGIRSYSVLSIQQDCGSSEGPWVWVEAVQSSTKFLYNFGHVAEDRLPPGTYSACWCEPSASSWCFAGGGSGDPSCRGLCSLSTWTVQPRWNGSLPKVRLCLGRAQPSPKRLQHPGRERWPDRWSVPLLPPWVGPLVVSDGLLRRARVQTS